MWLRLEGWSENYCIVMCLELATIGYFFNSMFGSNAYLPYIPVLAGLGEASYRLVERRQLQLQAMPPPERPALGLRSPLAPGLRLPPRRSV
jgi:hypothetical protein